MKIGFVVDDRLDKPDGVQQYVTHLGSWLQNQGHDVHYLVGNSPNAVQNNVHNVSKTVNVRFNKNRMAIPLPASKKAIHSLLAKNDFDILHVQMPYSPLLAGRIVAAAQPRTAVVGTFHILPHGTLSALGTKLLGTYLQRNMKRFSTFLSVSSAAQQFAKSHFGITSSVLPNVVDMTVFKNGEPITALRTKNNIVFLGRFVQRKGVLLLMQAYKRLLIDYPELTHTTRLVLCGDGPERQKVAVLQQELQASGADVLCAGFISETEKKDYLASAAIAVFPSTGGESFGIVLIEAMAAGAGVVLGGNNPGYATVLHKQPETLVDPNDTFAFSERLHLLLTNNTLQKRLHTAQQQAVKRYDVAVVGPQLVEVYTAALVQVAKKRNN